MKVKEFNELKKQVKKGNVEGLNQEVIESLTLSQAQAIEDLMLDLKLDEEKNHLLDEVVNHIDALVMEEKKVANTKAPKVKAKTEKVKAKTEKVKTKKEKLSDAIKVGQVIHFRVEGEEKEHDIKIIYIGKFNIIAMMVEDEREVFNIRKVDFDKQVFSWKDRHNEEYNIIVTL